MTALCPQCNNTLTQGESVSDGYSYACLNCEEDFYTIEIKQNFKVSSVIVESDKLISYKETA